MMRVTAISTLLAGLLSPVAKAEGDVYAVHGSGTTNPSKCIWHIMALFEERSRVTTRMTYRAVGSSTGQLEFLGKRENEDSSVTFTPHNDFGAGDIPIPTDNYNGLKANTSGMLHLPFALSSVSFFHNIPGVPDGKGGLKLTSCLLARIFDGKINKWDDPEILAENSHLEQELKDVSSGADDFIYVSRRVHGSSSTSSITKYLNEACPNEWPTSKVGSELGAKGLDEWHVGTHACQGSSEMTSCIRNNKGSIGYLDSGHGWSEKLAEVNIQNKDEFFVSSRIAFEKGGITDAASMATDLPDSADADWGHVHFINKSGEWTWPIVVMSYVYVRKNLGEQMDNHQEAGLLKLFLESLYDESYFGKCKDLGFSKVPRKLSDMAADGLETVDWGFTENMWSFEYKDETRKVDGMGKFVISGKRQNLAGLTIDDIAGKETAVQAKIKDLESVLLTMLEELEMEVVITEGKIEIQRAAVDHDHGQGKASLVLSVMSFTILCCVGVFLAVNKLCPRKSYTLAEAQPGV